MHEIQRVLLQVIQERGIRELPPLRKLGEMTGKRLSAQQVKHHLEQLEKKNFFSLKKKAGKTLVLFHPQTFSPSKTNFVSLPIYGTANCGPALSLAEQRPEGYIKISSSGLKRFDKNNLFIVRASGDSMNKAKINDRTIDDGDYLIVDTSKKNPTGKGEIVLSVIDGAANVKKFFRSDSYFVLASDSSQEYPPIYISPEDDFMINGTIVEVMKKPKI